MSSALLEAPATLFAAATAAPAHTPRPSGRGRTLAELLDDTWRAARSGAEADCPICHRPMHQEADVATCDSCGTTLS